MLIAIGIPLWLIASHPWVALLVIAAVIACVVAYGRSRNCGICGVALKRTVYRWDVDGAQANVCPNCNRTLEKRQSNRALGVL
jgi:hypothetical protein